MPAKRIKRTRASTERTREVTKEFFSNSPPEETREQWYPLASDPGLQAAGVEIGARIIIPPWEPPKMRIVFRAGGTEASVACVHVAVYVGPLESLPSDEELARSSENHPVKLALEEHFFALNSFVAGIAEVGLETMFAAAREAGDLPVRFNSLMQQQVLDALFRVAATSALHFYLMVTDDLLQREKCSIPIPPVFDNMRDFLMFGEERRPVYAEPRKEVIPPEFLVRYARDGEWRVRSGVARHEGTPPETLARLSLDVNACVRGTVAINPKTSPEVLVHLAGDPDNYVRCGVARNANTPREALAHLALDEDLEVREALTWNNKTPPETLARLSGDDSLRVRLSSRSAQEKLRQSKHKR